LPALLDRNLDCIKLIACDGSVEYVNNNGLCAMEVDDSCELAGQRWSDLWPAEVRPVIEEALISAGTGRLLRFDAYCPFAKASPRWWDVSVSQLSDAIGRKLGFLAVSRDVTQSRVAKEVPEIATAEMRHRLKNNYAMVGGLADTVLRSPCKADHGGPGKEQQGRCKGGLNMSVGSQNLGALPRSEQLVT
jgi:hypothetical protein